METDLQKAVVAPPANERQELGEAAVFMATVRQAQLESGSLLRGRTRLSPETRFAIKTISSENAVIIGMSEALEVGREMLEPMYERFEEMCRRQKHPIEDRLRPAVYERLTLELWINHKAVPTGAPKLMSATLYHGAIGQSLTGAFPEFTDSSSIFVYALENYPFNCFKFLKQVQLNIEQMSQEDEFKSFPPHIIKYAAINKPLDPRQFLRQVHGTVAGILHESEFRSLHNRRSTVLRAAVTNPLKTREALRGRLPGRQKT